ncbi:hypothetical protein M3Y97_00144000 [Aphelenchoides bicaudatus]|nr:hypothetical protein M3Y97_00144000 [Aphelenchoides bicaudatus]
MIDCVQLRLELLRHHVRRQNHQDNLLAQSQQPACTPHFPNELGPIAAAFHNNSRTVLFQLTNTNRPLPMSRFTVTPVVTNHQPPVNKVQKQAPANNRMLHVRVHNDPLLSASPMISQLNNRFHFGATAHSSPANQPMFRSRSASECLEFRQSSTLASSNNGSSNSSLSPNGTPLRSILKKPKVLAPGLGNTSIVAASTNGLRRAPTRYVLSRSVSECHDDQVLIDNDLQLIDNEIVSMEDLSVCNGSPLSVVDEESCESNSSDEPMKSVSEQHKKRVSFNEQVMARIYRSNSSIIATKNKQERKLRNRLRRRAESESSEPVTVDDLVRIPTIPLSKLSAEEKDQDGSPNCDDDQKDSLPVNERRDSGFDSNDSGMESPEEAMQVETSAKRVQRVISSDSAFGDELME